MASDPVVLVGAGLAGARAAEALRQAGDDRDIVLVGEEPEAPYERPALSKAVLRGEEPDDSVRVHAPDFYRANGIELLAGARAVDLDVAGRRVGLADGRVLPFSAVLLATGAAPRRLPVPGADLPGVLSLRSLADARALRARLRDGGRLVVVGGGWIGCEVAASARQTGVDVTLVDPLPLPLVRVLGERVGLLVRDLHADHGVSLRLGTEVTGFEGDTAVRHVVTATGDRLPADTVVVGVGVTPRTELAVAAGLPVGDGVLVSETLRATAGPVFAAGDVAAAYHPRLGRHLRVEHWANALHQGPAAAASMLGSPAPYSRLPYFFSDQYDLGLEYVGHASRWDRFVVRGSIGDRRFLGFYLDRGRVVAGIAVNVWDRVDDLRSLVESGEPVDPAALADADVDLARLPATPR